MKNEKINGGGWRAKKGDLQVATEHEEIETEGEEQRQGALPNFSHTRETANREERKDQKCSMEHFVHKPSIANFFKVY